MTTNRRTHRWRPRWSSAPWSVLLCLLVQSAALTAAPAPVRAVADRSVGVLLVTGQDYPGHRWRETTPVIRAALEADPRFEVRVLEDPHALDTAALGRYRTVILHFQNWQVAGPGAAARTNLRRYVAGGGGLMSVHFACGAWHGEWPEYQNILGRVWHGTNGPQHDPRGPFAVRVIDPAHPVVAGLGDFETDDELYTCLTGDAPIRVVAEATSRVDRRVHPMAFVRSYERGRVFLTTLGHDVRALTNAAVSQLLRQACAWTGGLTPQEPVAAATQERVQSP